MLIFIIRGNKTLEKLKVDKNIKKNVENIFGRNKTISIADIAKELNVGHDEVIVTCQELEKEGKINLVFSRNKKKKKGK